MLFDVPLSVTSTLRARLVFVKMLPLEPKQTERQMFTIGKSLAGIIQVELVKWAIHSHIVYWDLGLTTPPSSGTHWSTIWSLTSSFHPLNCQSNIAYPVSTSVGRNVSVAEGDSPLCGAGLLQGSSQCIRADGEHWTAGAGHCNVLQCSELAMHTHSLPLWQSLLHAHLAAVHLSSTPFPSPFLHDPLSWQECLHIYCSEHFTTRVNSGASTDNYYNLPNCIIVTQFVNTSLH